MRKPISELALEFDWEGPDGVSTIPAEEVAISGVHRVEKAPTEMREPEPDDGFSDEAPTAVIIDRPLFPQPARTPKV
jgi:hypothetical protein